MSIVRKASPIAICAMMAFSMPAHAPLARGYTYDMVQRAQSTNPMTGASQEVTAVRAHVTVDAAGNTRMDISEAGANPMWGVGDYMLTSANSVLVVSPSKKEVLDLGTDMGMSEIQEFMKSMGADMKIGDAVMTLDSLPGTELVNGHQAKHFKLTRDGTVQMNTPAGAMEINVKSSSDFFVTRDKAPTNSPFVSMNNTGGAGGMMSPATFEKTKTMMGAIKGFVVRSSSHSASQVMGMNTESTQTLEIENLKEVDVAPISVVAPDGYTKGSLGARMRAMSVRGPGG